MTRESPGGARGQRQTHPGGLGGNQETLTRGDPRPGVGVKAAGSSRGCPGRVPRAVQVHLRPRSARGTPHLGLRQRPGAASEEGKPPVLLQGATDCTDLTHTQRQPLSRKKKIRPSQERPTDAVPPAAPTCVPRPPTSVQSRQHHGSRPQAVPGPGSSTQRTGNVPLPADGGSAGNRSQSWGSGRAGIPAGTWAGQHGSGAHKCRPGSAESCSV